VISQTVENVRIPDLLFGKVVDKEDEVKEDLKCEDVQGSQVQDY